MNDRKKTGTSIRFDPEQFDEVDRIATENGLTFAAVVRMLVSEALRARRGAEPQRPAPVPAIPAEARDLMERLASFFPAPGQPTPWMSPLGGIAEDQSEAPPAARAGTSAPLAGVTPIRRGVANVDAPRDLHETELPVVAYAAAGEGRHPTAEPTGETVLVMNPMARAAKRHRMQVVKVAGDSMEPEYQDGDFVIIEPAQKESLRDGDVAFVLYHGEGMLKILRFKRDRQHGGMQDLQLESLNASVQPPIPVSGDDPDFFVIGIEAYHIARKRSFR